MIKQRECFIGTFIKDTLIMDNEMFPTNANAANLSRRGMPIGVKVTLRGIRMYEFLERLIAVSLPRIRDFKGVSENFDGRGNYTMGVKEQIIFPEIDIDKITKVMGMEITFVTTATKDEEAFALLREFGIPFKNIKHNN